MGVSKNEKLVIFLSAFLLFAATTAQAQECDEFFVTAIAGDSITNAYWTEFKDAAPEAWEIHKVALGGLRAEVFNGKEPKVINGIVIDYTQDLIDIGPVNVVLMLGTNDSFVGWDHDHDHSVAFTNYTDSMTSILDRLDEAGIAVILGIPTPMQGIPRGSAKNAAGEVLLEALYRPWLREEAEFRGLLIVDFFDVFVSYPGWEDLFADGVHPYTDEGGYLMADAATDAICLQYVPEPGLWLSILAGAVTLALLKFRAPSPKREL